ELADRVEELDVGRRVRARRPADRLLVDRDDLVEEVRALDAVVRARLRLRAHELPRERRQEDLVDEGALPGARDAGDADERPEREVDREAAEVVGARVDDPDRLAAERPPRLGDRDRLGAGEVLPGERPRVLLDLLRRPL